MDVARISEVEVRRALESIRSAEPLGACALLGMESLRTNLRREGVTVTPPSLERALADLLADTIWFHLAHCRGVSPERDPQDLRAEMQHRQLAEDFAAGDAEREAWSALFHRYVICQCLTEKTIGALAKPDYRYGDRHFRRRLDRGIRSLTVALRDLEVGEAVEDHRQHNLPHLLTRFIGRESEMGEVRTLLSQHRLVTLTGAGGIGKSRLAVEVGRALAADYPDGVWLAELGAVADGARVVSAVASVLGVREQARCDPIDTLRDHLEAKHLLLLLDNCEHLAHPCGEMVQTLLAQCPDLQVLATSRERLHVAGEVAWPVPGMSLPEREAVEVRPSGLLHYDAVRLFTDRAATAMPGFGLTAENAPHVTEVCCALDGIPLAVELAAARVKLLSPKELAGRLGERLDLFRDGYHPLRPQHETLRTAMDWSHDLLDQRERILFRRLSVFRAGWTLAEAEAVCAGGNLATREVVGLLGQLVDKSLVEVRRANGSRRFDMLQSVTQYAEERLEVGGERADVHGRHLACFLALAEKLDRALVGPGTVAALDRLQVEHANVRAALAWAQATGDADSALRLCCAMYMFWTIRGHIGVARTALTESFRVPGAPRRTTVRASALRALGALTSGVEGADPERHYQESLAICMEVGDTAGVAASLLWLGAAAKDRCRFDEARELWERSLGICRELGDRREIAVRLNCLGLLAKWRRDWPSAHALYEEALAIGRDVGDKRFSAVVLRNLGNVWRYEGDYDRACATWEASRTEWVELGSEGGLAGILADFATAALHRGDHDAAQALWTESLALSQRDGNVAGTALAQRCLAAAAIGLGDIPGARPLLASGTTTAIQTGDALGVSHGLGVYASLALACRDADRAARLLGASDACRERAIGPVELAKMAPDQRTAIEAVVTFCRAALGDAAFDAGYGEGRKMTMDEAVAYALEDIANALWHASTG
jgi:predicted ATPase